MQRLIEEVERSNRNTPSETEIIEDNSERDMAAQHNDQFAELYDEAWKSEESDGASLQELPITDFPGLLETSGYEDVVNSAIAEVSKDFLTGLRPPAKHNDSEESQLSSDTDFKLVTGMAYCARYPETTTGLSDTDWNPYGTESDNNPSPRHQDSSGHLSETKMSWNPPLHSTDINVVTPFSNYSQTRVGSINESKDIRDGLVRQDVTADFSTISHISESGASPVRGQREMARDSKCPELNKTMRTETHTTDSIRDGPLGDDRPHKLATHEVSTLSGRMMSTESSTSSRRGEGMDGSQYVSVLERAKLIGIPQDILKGQKTNQTDGALFGELTPDTSVSQANTSDNDPLGRNVQQILYKTEHLEDRSEGSSGVDYHSLQRDLQEIQDSLQQSLGSGDRIKLEAGKKKSPVTSDSDIIPSTTTTPERQKKTRMAWDFAADLGGYSNTENMFREISLDTHTTGSHRPSSEKHGFHSDGEETHTSEGSSSKHDHHDHHAAADQALADMSEILQPLTSGLHRGTDVDQMLSDFRDQRMELESRYEQLNNQGLAQKVYRILSHQDPSSQANGILSEVSASEKEMKTRYALGLDWKDCNLSDSSKTGMDESNASMALPDDVRRRLDLSNVSSVDTSRGGDKGSFSLPSKKGFAAFDDMTNFLSSQMAKASERSFNHSIEMRLPPQHVQCYPVYGVERGAVGGIDKEEDNEKKDEDRTSPKSEGLLETVPREAPQETEEKPRTESPHSEGENRNNSSPDSLSGTTGLGKERYRPYRPAGSRELYYTESDTASVADSVTTLESTHIGSDDARGPSLPQSVLGSRADPPSTKGIYGSRKQTSQGVGDLPTIQERSTLGDDKDSESSKSRDTPTSQPAPRGADADEGVTVSVRTEYSKPASPGKCSVEGARRDARWQNRMDELSGSSPELDRGRTARTEDRDAGDVYAGDGFRDIGPRSYQVRGDNENYSGVYTRERQPTSLPSDAFVRSREDWRDRQSREVTTAEPLSLRIKMTFEDDPNKEGNSRETDVKEKYSERLGGSDRPAAYSSYERDRARSPSPVYRSQRSLSPESHLYGTRVSEMRSPQREDDLAPARDARVSTAFHRALSPELRTAIESRSPILSRQIERSLSQPPAYQTRVQDSNRPTFLAREKGYHSSADRFGPQDDLPSTRSLSSIPRAWSPTSEPRDREMPRPRSPQADRYRREDERLGRDELPLHRASSPQADRLRRADERDLPLQRGRSPVRGRSPSPIRRSESPLRARSPSLRAQSPLRRSQSPTSGAVKSHSASSRGRSPVQGREADSRGNALLRYKDSGLRVEPEEPLRNKLRGQAWSDSRQDGTETRSKSPVPQRYVELTLEGMSSDSEADKDIDHQPISKRLQLLTHALVEEERDAGTAVDINQAWEQFKAGNESPDSSMSSGRVDAVSDLLKNPAHHRVRHYLQERQQYQLERQDRAQRDLLRQQQEQQHLQQLSHSTTEEEASMVQAVQASRQAQDRQRRRAGKKKKGANGNRNSAGKDQGNVENNAPDNLFSIAEDSFEQSPNKQGSSSIKRSKSGTRREHNVIDPNMNKLRDRIHQQRHKIDKGKLKELQRVERVRRLEELLTLKKSGEIGDGTLQREMEEISNTSSPSQDSVCLEPASDDSTTAKDSSSEMHRWKAEKERRVKENKRMAEMAKERFHNHEKQGSLQKPSKERNDELRLLRLVKEGQLTPDEAYLLAVGRVGDVNGTSPGNGNRSMSSSSWNDSRPHKKYKPYMRHQEETYERTKHVPKLCVPYDDTNNNRKMQEQLRNASRESNYMGMDVGQDYFTKLNGDRDLSSGLNVNPRDYRAQRPLSRSPPRRVKVYSPPRKPVQYRTRSASPSSQGYWRGRQQPSQHREKKKPAVPIEPVRDSVAWHIPIDKHPSQWTEPANNDPTPSQSSHGGAYKGSQLKNKEKKSRTGTLHLEDLEHKPTLQQKDYHQAWCNGHDDGVTTSASSYHAQPCEQSVPSKHKTHKTSIFDEPEDGCPVGIPREEWARVVSQDRLACKENHWEVDPLRDRVQYILNKPTSSARSGSSRDGAQRQTGAQTLQEAFLSYKQSCISHLKERQKRLALSKENRQMQECLRVEREAIFSEHQRNVPPNLFAHPYSDNLFQPKNRIITKHEMKEMAKKKYNNLPEVLQKKENEVKAQESKLNRLRARLFNKKVQRDVLKKSTMRQR